MIDGKNVLAIIPARGGSKGVLRKNIRNVGDKPLIAWTIEAAKKSKYIDRLVLSSDDDEIIKVAIDCGCEAPFVRPAELARDDTPGIDVVLHALDTLPGFYYIVLLQPTSPLRTEEDIDTCIERCSQREAVACVSVVEPGKSPYWMYVLDEFDRMTPLIKLEKAISRRQDLPGAYAVNGAVYVAECGWLLKTRSFLGPETLAYIMPMERSIDVDTEFDLNFCDWLLTTKKV